MRKVLNYALGGVVALNLMFLTILTPWDIWHYTKEHCFIRCVSAGEIVAIPESLGWPQFVFFDRNCYAESPGGRHYVNSKKACDEAMKIIVKAGDVARLSPGDKGKVADLLRLAISEANLVSPSYLQKVHPQFPEIYEKNYKYAINLLVQGLRTDNIALVLAGAYGYNEFVEWMKAHEKELSF